MSERITYTAIQFPDQWNTLLAFENFFSNATLNIFKQNPIFFSYRLFHNFSMTENTKRCSVCSKSRERYLLVIFSLFKITWKISSYDFQFVQNHVKDIFLWFSLKIRMKIWSIVLSSYVRLVREGAEQQQYIISCKFFCYLGRPIHQVRSYENDVKFIKKQVNDPNKEKLLN